MPVSKAGCDHRTQQRGSNLQEPLLLVLRHAPVSAVVFPQLANQGLRSASERRAIQVLPPDSPVQHVSEQLDRAIDRGVRERAGFAVTMDDAPRPKIGDEVLDVGGPYFSNPMIAEMLKERLQPVIDGACEGEPISNDVALLVQRRELTERQRAGLRR